MKRLGLAAVIVLLALTTLQAQVPAGGAFVVQTNTSRLNLSPSVAVEDDGNFIVVWTSLGSSFGIAAQRFDATGARRGGEFQVNTSSIGNQQSFLGHDADVDRAGNFVVVWSSDPEPGGSGRGNFGQLYDSGGNAVGGEFHVNTFTPYNQSQSQHGPRVAMAPAGTFVVVWDSVAQDGDNYGVFGQRFDAAGTPLGAEFRVNTATAGRQLGSNIDMDSAGNFVVVWAGDGISGFEVFAQRFDAGGNRVGGEFQVNTSTSGNQGYFGPGDPKVAVSSDGAFVVVWQNLGVNPRTIVGQRFDRSGNRVGGEITIDPGQDVPTSTSLGMDALGNFVATWWEGSVPNSRDIYAQRMSASDVPRGGPFIANPNMLGPDLIPSVACDDVGNFVIAWEHSTTQTLEATVFAQRFGGLRPQALSVDAAGNRVLDPGETAVVQPAWRNINGASLTFGGALSSLTGPAGPAYSIADGAGSYGTVPDSASGTCTDCYAVSVSGARPATHWDALAVETITPDALGQQKQWLLHVGGSFTDVSAASPFYPFVETLLHNGVTAGCGAGLYCASSSTAREQMAVFVLVTRERTGFVPPACGTPMFTDVPATSPFCPWIEELARRGVVSGCGGGSYCPGSPVSREQMSVFVLRVLEPAFTPPSCTTPMFTDVPAASPFCPWIEELARRGVVTGCGPAAFCPADPVTREQMGVFLTATFGLTLYGP